MAGLDDYSGTFNDKLDQYLSSLGLTGTLNDKINDSSDYSGNVDQKLMQYYLYGVPVGSDEFLLLEDDDYLLLETGDKLILE